MSQIPCTQEGYDKLVIEERELLEKRPEAVLDLKKARDMGDLSENGYYKAARQKVSFIDFRLRVLKDMIKRSVIITANPASDNVGIGSTVILYDGEKEITYSIVGGFESNPQEGKISHVSPLGSKLMGRKKGEVVEITSPQGSSTYKIYSLK